SVVLFDEIEKAHQDVFNILLQILDDGRLTDSKGRVIDFKNTVLIMTSNLGSRQIQAATTNPLADRDINADVLQVLRDHFKPEFLNRIDDIVVFGQLSRDQIATIIDVQLEKLRENLDERGIAIELDDSARELIIEKGYDPIYGARPLRRAIQSLIQNPLAVSLLKGEITSGHIVRVSASEGEMKFISDEDESRSAIG
ncbi:MAG: AAA family ATPase, partial [Pyrinomonadaceae bacterium]